MASRRLNSDRFFTTDYTPQVYTQAGMDWIDDNDMRTALLRHYPALRPAMRGLENAFQTWHRATECRSRRRASRLSSPGSCSQGVAAATRSRAASTEGR
jgi:hypothetical protein